MPQQAKQAVFHIGWSLRDVNDHKLGKRKYEQHRHTRGQRANPVVGAHTTRARSPATPSTTNRPPCCGNLLHWCRHSPENGSLTKSRTTGRVIGSERSQPTSEAARHSRDRV